MRYTKKFKPIILACLKVYFTNNVSTDMPPKSNRPSFFLRWKWLSTISYCRLSLAESGNIITVVWKVIFISRLSRKFLSDIIDQIWTDGRYEKNVWGYIKVVVPIKLFVFKLMEGLKFGISCADCKRLVIARKDA